MITNPWVGPLQRSYQQIKSKLIEKLLELKHPNGSPLITDVSEGNILVLILSMFAGIGEVIHYYIDNLARETFFSTARRYDSLLKHASLVDYHPKLASAAQCDVVFTRSLTDTQQPVTIPAGTQVTDANGQPWESISEVTMPSGVSQVTAHFIQHSKVVGQLTGLVAQDPKGIRGVTLTPPSSGNYEHMSAINVKVGSESYSEVETFAYSSPTDKHFIMVTNEEGSVSLIFGDGKFGKQPSVGQAVTGDIYITQGSKGNIPEASITGNYQGCSYSNFAAGGGSDYEDFDTLKRRVPLSVKTMGVAITKQDYVDLAKQVAGVSQVALEYICGRKLNLYISAVGGGQPNGLTTTVKNYLQLHSPLNTWLNVQFAEQSQMVLKIDVTGRPSYKSLDIKNSIISALQKAYPTDGPIGGKVRLSDIYALIDNLAPVDYLRILQFYIMPWPKVIMGNAQLSVSEFSIKSTNGVSKYIVEFTSATAFRILPYENITTLESSSTPSYQKFEGTLGNMVTINYPEGFEFDIKFKGNGFQEGFKYEFTVADTDLDYNQSGFNIPVFNAQNLTLNITETT